MFIRSTYNVYGRMGIKIYTYRVPKNNNTMRKIRISISFYHEYYRISPKVSAPPIFRHHLAKLRAKPPNFGKSFSFSPQSANNPTLKKPRAS